MVRRTSVTDDDLEAEARNALHDYFTDTDPNDQILSKARIAQATYGAIQKKRQTDGARLALRWMMIRETADAEQAKRYVTSEIETPRLDTLRESA
jgi:hypothetical protein